MGLRLLIVKIAFPTSSDLRCLSSVLCVFLLILLSRCLLIIIHLGMILIDGKSNMSMHLILMAGKVRHLHVLENRGVVSILEISKCLYDAIVRMERAVEKGKAITTAVKGVEKHWGTSVSSWIKWKWYLHFSRHYHLLLQKFSGKRNPLWPSNNTNYRLAILEDEHLPHQWLEKLGSTFG
ncbi:hypothetical protein L1987_08814 [Smallanthus sonchifolius]|uniref:Uncharacterized protein n=1 Tax=Smallanthus sonchifolius TaxID=185202 RepID=A0ACB9JNG9_9ASTR|nr:hypothetical protein L1987_08814 [Smallanthus sonchifolius]